METQDVWESLFEGLEEATKVKEAESDFQKSQRLAAKYQNLTLRFRILEKFCFTCQYCGRSAPEVVLHIDHIIPRAKGGKNSLDNYTVACFDCNEGKKDIILSERAYNKTLEHSVGTVLEQHQHPDRPIPLQI